VSSWNTFPCIAKAVPGARNGSNPGFPAGRIALPDKETIMTFRFRGISPTPFAPLFDLADAALAARGMRRVVADAKPGFPCRVTLKDAEPGEQLLLLPFEHQPAHSPYRASGPIFVGEKARTPYDDTHVPPGLKSRRLSLRAYDGADCIVASDVLMAGDDIEAALAGLFAREDTAYVHVHNAGHGCFACRVERA
jgi:hypothetical protein